MTAQLPSRERWETLIRAIECESYDEEEIVSWVNSDEILSMARFALAAQEQEPVAWQWQNHGQWHVTTHEERARDLAWDGVEVLPLYTHPAPVPAVPAKWPEKLTWSHHDDVTQAEVLAWNYAIDACRAALLSVPAVPDDVLAICQRLIKEYIANKGTSSEFICCVTPSRKTIGTGGVWDDWRALDKAVHAAMLNGGKS